MTQKDILFSDLPLKQDFRDAHERRAYRRAEEIARRILNDPTLVQKGRAYLDRFVRGDPHQFRAFETWNRLLDTSPDTIASQLLADSAQGAFLRETAPAFDEITAEQARLLWAPPPR